MLSLRDLDGKASSNPLASVINYLGQFYLKVCLTQILQWDVESFPVHGWHSYGVGPKYLREHLVEW